jgi:hypothetical protein
MDPNARSNAVQVVRARRLDGGILLGHDTDELRAVRVLVEELHRAFPAYRERQDGLREDHRVPERENGNTPMDLALTREL